ncbi:MAG TPA: hypothetical protein VFK38_03510 [Candidatus Limnocylindrales bacterium]|nr:hypothetical protein [Candidatus Limnocylindrales bacterium]
MEPLTLRGVLTILGAAVLASVGAVVVLMLAMLLAAYARGEIRF